MTKLFRVSSNPINSLFAWPFFFRVATSLSKYLNWEKVCETMRCKKQLYQLAEEVSNINKTRIFLTSDWVSKDYFKLFELRFPTCLVETFCYVFFQTDPGGSFVNSVFPRFAFSLRVVGKKVVVVSFVIQFGLYWRWLYLRGNEKNHNIREEITAKSWHHLSLF